MKEKINNSHSLTLAIPNISGVLILLAILLLSIFITSCKDELDYTIDQGKPVEMTATASEIVLSQKMMNNTALSLQWTTGTNKGTGSAISYWLELDRSGNNFASPKTWDMGKGIYVKHFTVKELNDLLLNEWSITAGTSVALEARVIADVYNEAVEDGISDPVTFTVNTYQPVSTTLYLIGSAAPGGWDVNNATALIPDENDPTTFRYQGSLLEGEFKFITEKGNFLPSYNKGGQNSQLVLRTSDDQPDEKFIVAEAGNYNLVVNLVDLTLSLNLLPGPPYDMLYMVGSATSIGWDIGNALEVPQNPDNLFQFIYEGVLVPGEFKFPVNRQTDWGQDMFMPVPDDPSRIYLHKGGDADDNKWTIESENWYKIVLDLSKYTISIDPFKLYIIGSATPVGWSIDQAIELEQDPDNWYLFRYTGELGEGEFKFPVNRQTDWGQDMYMKDPSDPSKMYRHKGGDPDDSKWVFTAADAGSYILTLNVQELTIDLQKQ